MQMNTNFLKKHADFFLIIAFFAIPPIFSSSQNIEQNIEQISDQHAFSPAAPISTFLLQSALSLYILFKMKFGKKDIKSFFFLSSFSILCLLLLNATVWNFIAGFFSSSSQNEIKKIIPEDFWTIFYICLSLFVSALYEELLYRKFIPDETISFTLQDKSLLYRIISEILIILIFALGHRYLGVWAVLNAFTAGCILRFFCIRTGSFISGFIAHLIYNLIVFFLY